MLLLFSWRSLGLPQHRFRAAQAVHRSGNNASCIPCALPAGIQAPGQGRLAVLVPQHPHRGRTPGFRGSEQRIAAVKPPQPPPQDRQGFPHGFHHKGGQTLSQIPRHYTGFIGGVHRAQVRGGPPHQKVRHPLGWG